MLKIKTQRKRLGEGGQPGHRVWWECPSPGSRGATKSCVVDQMAAPTCSLRSTGGVGGGDTRGGFRGSGSPALNSLLFLPLIRGHRHKWHLFKIGLNTLQMQGPIPPPFPATLPSQLLYGTALRGHLHPCSDITHVHPRQARFPCNTYCHLPFCLCMCVFHLSPQTREEAP